MTSIFQVYCFPDRFHFPPSSCYSPFPGPAFSPRMMARFQPHRTPEEGPQSHNYLLAVFQRFPQNEAAGPLSQNALPRWAAPWQFQALLDFWHEHKGPVCRTVSEVTSSISEKADLERENVGEDVFIWILANFNSVSSLKKKYIYIFKKKVLGGWVNSKKM